MGMVRRVVGGGGSAAVECILDNLPNPAGVLFFQKEDQRSLDVKTLKRIMSIIDLPPVHGPG